MFVLVNSIPCIIIGHLVGNLSHVRNVNTFATICKKLLFTHISSYISRYRTGTGTDTSMNKDLCLVAELREVAIRLQALVP